MQEDNPQHSLSSKESTNLSPENQGIVLHSDQAPGGCSCSVWDPLPRPTAQNWKVYSARLQDTRWPTTRSPLQRSIYDPAAGMETNTTSRQAAKAV